MQCKISVLFVLMCTFFYGFSAQAKSVIFMIGDGMGYNHIDCVNEEFPLFMSTLQPNFVKTASADYSVTDSAASATSYACGIKTNNGYLGLTPDEKTCETLAEKAVENNIEVYIVTTDDQYGATPSAFYVHENSRYNKEGINKYLENAGKKMHLSFNVSSVAEEIKKILDVIKNNPAQEYFVVVEGAKIDKASHQNDYKWMMRELIDFDKAVKEVWEFADSHDIAVVVTADHETGGLSEVNCHFTIGNHSGVDIPIYTKGISENISSVIDNTEVYRVIDKTLYTD